MNNKILTVLSASALLVACTSVPSPQISWEEEFVYPAWKGESIHAVAVINSDVDLTGVSLAVTGVKTAKADFVFDVIGDELDPGYGQCGSRAPGQYDSIIVADRIGPDTDISIPAGKAQKVWLGVKVPSVATPGTYNGSIKVKGKGFKTVSLPFSYQVVDETLPEPKEWAFHLDLWQNPYSVARYFNVPLWSKEHFAKMKPVYERLAAAGQKVVTTTIIDRPWNGQTEDPFGTMVTKTLNQDGTWSYDYTVFDNWVEFMFSLGIDSQINCYSLIPWKLSFDYFDAATSEIKFVEGAPGSEEYNAYWAAFIKDFAAHLRSKGWFEKTMLAMDERPREAMIETIKLIRNVEPEMKFSLAGLYHDDIQEEFADLCITSTVEFPEEIIAARRAEGKISTYYLCCAEKFPNSFIASNPKEAAWFGWYAQAHNFDGFLRWAYNSWTADPNKDARFRSWAAGDCYIVYPLASSVRFEYLIQGVQDYEKVRILKARWEEEGNTEKLDALSKALDNFNLGELAVNGPERALQAAKQVISE